LEADGPAPFARRGVLAIGAGAAVLLLLVSARYGYHRDELYFVEAGRHLAWGYVDQPPFAPAVARLAAALFGSSLTSLRFFPALSDGIMVVLAGLIARELGGGRTAQLLAALSVAATGEYLGAGHLLSPTPFDQLAWVAVALIVIRILRTGDERLWLAAGAAAGAGLLNKWTVLFLAFGLGVGFLLTPARRHLRSPWLWAGAALAVAIWVPNLVWQAQHGWPVWILWRNLHGEALQDGNLFTFVPAQLLYVGLLLLPVWVAGLRWLFRDPAGRPFAAFAWAYVVLFAVLWATAGKPYYIGPMYGVLLPAGAVATERFLARRAAAGRPGWLTARRIAIAIVVEAIVLLPVALPILPARALHTIPLQNINYDLGETIGWPRFASTVATVYRALPVAERAHAVIFTQNYGEAGAIDRYGPALGLPAAYSGHNSFWYWGPPPPAAPGEITIAIGYYSRSYLERFFGTARLAAHIHNGLGVSNDEEGAQVWVCGGPRAGWAAIWPSLRHFN
jgi:hypothetical protein